jgi:protein-tyrosine-phosphatase
MAEAFFNQLAGGKAKALSAGTQPAQEVNPTVVRVMQEAGVDISKNKPKMLTIDMVEEADEMITMGCGAEAEAVCPANIIETDDWELDDPKGKLIDDVRRIRDEVRTRVISLLKKPL